MRFPRLTPPRRSAAQLGVLGLLLAAALLYLPGAKGPYLADDIPNLVHNRHLVIDDPSWESLKAAALSSPASPWYRPLSMLSFAFSYSLAGSMDPRAAKLFNIVLHLATGLLVFLLTRALLPSLRTFSGAPLDYRDRERIALLLAGFWLLHPLHVSTVLYTVQRMAMLSTFFMLAGCLFYAHFRPALTRSGKGVLLLAAVSALLGTAAFLSKENGALLPGFLLLVEFFLFGLRLPATVPRAARALFLAMLMVPAVFIVLYLAYQFTVHLGQDAGAYYFSTGERILTQFRALAQYAGWLLMIAPQPMGLYHDDFGISSGLLSPPTTLACIGLWTAAGTAAAALLRRRHVLSFALLWFLWGHILESTVLPLSPVFEHRNYLPGFGLLLGFTMLLYEGVQRLRLAPAFRMVLLAAVLIVLPAGRLFDRVGAWADERELVMHAIENQPASALTLLMAATFLDARDDYDGALTALKAARAAAPEEVSLVFAEAALHCEHRPQEDFDPELRAALDRVSAGMPRTTTARQQFVAMARACSEFPAVSGSLLPLYRRLSRDRHYEVAMLALYGIGAIYLQRADLRAAAVAWGEAVDRYPQAAALAPELEKLRHRIEARGSEPGAAEKE